MKKLLSLLLVAVTALCFGAGCYHVKAEKLSRIVGTYELTSYSQYGGEAKYNLNYIEERHAVGYLVVAQSGFGYLVYQDDNTPLTVKEVSLRFIQSTEEAGKYEYVEYKTDTDSEYTKLGYANKGLNSTRPTYGGNIFEGNYRLLYNTGINYKRVDRAQDLSYVSKKLSLPTVLKYGEGRFNGLYYLNYLEKADDGTILTDKSPYVYAFLETDIPAGKAHAYYMLKSDEVKQERKDIPVSLVKENGAVIGIKLGSQTFEAQEATYNGTSSYLYFPYTLQGDEGEIACRFSFVNYGGTHDVEYQIQAQIDWYNSQKPVE